MTFPTLTPTGLEPPTVSAGEAKYLQNRADSGGAESGAVGARKGAKQDSNTALAEWLDGCPIRLSDDQQARVTEIIEGEGGDA